MAIHMPSLRALMGGGFLLAVSGSPALAQQQALNGGATEAADIVVTAQKRSERAQDVPIALSALSQTDMRAAGINGTADLKAAVPALNFTTGTGGFGLPRIRGIGATGQGPGIENPVAVYIDGVYYGSASSVMQSLFDSKQVTVLKGPQGTLFGRNATGGLIQISTEGPTDHWTGKAELGYGNYRTVNGGAYIAGPISDTASVSVSGQYEKRDQGFGKNVLTGHDIQTSESYAARAKLLWQPSSETSVLAAFDLNGRDAADPAFVNIGLNTLGQNVQTLIAKAGGNSQRDIYADVDPKMRARQKGGSVTIEQGIGFARLKSITAYRESTFSYLFDPDGTASPFIRVNNSQFDRQLSQEINLTSQGNGPLKWVLGGFYMWDSAGGNPENTTGIYTFGNNGYTNANTNVRLSSWSGFAEGTYTLAPETHLIAGIRYTSDARHLTAQTISFNGNTGTTTQSALTDAQHTFNQATWRVSLDHRLSREAMVYASYNRGFRSGTYIAQAAASGTVPLLNPEQVDAFELGAKTDLLNRRLRINIAGYYYNEKNIQVMQVIAGVQNVYNAQGAHIYGLDADVSLKVSETLRLFGGVNVTHARYTSFTDAVITVPFPVAAGFSPASYTYLSSKTGTVVANTGCLGTFGAPAAQLGGNCLLYGDASGHKLQNTPDVTFSMGGAWDVPTAIGRFTLAGNYYYNGGYVGSPDERVAQPAYGLLDASLTWRLPSEKIYVRAWGRNLGDTFYRTQIGATNSGSNGTAAAPRTYGLSVGVEF